MPLTPGGFTASSSRRRGRGRRRAVIAFALVLVLVAAGGVAYVLKSRSDERKLDEQAAAAASAYLAAWQTVSRPPAEPPTDPAAEPTPTGAPEPTADDPAAPAPPAEIPGRGEVTAVSVAGDIDVNTLVTTMADVAESLEVSEATYTPGELSRSGDTATVPYQASLELAGFPTPYAYGGQLSLVRDGGDWKVKASLTAVHPALAPGLRLSRTASTADRGELLDVDGRPLRDDVELAGNLVGSVDPPTGYERVFNDDLTPQGGEVVVLDSADATVQTLASYPMTDGAEIRTTLDLDVQAAGEAAMATSPAPNGALVAIDTTTGGVLAIVNHPLNGYGRALHDYPPGSTFKIITATAALANGTTADTPIDCSPEVFAGGRRVVNAENEAFGVIPFREVFSHSCNTAFVRVEQSMPDDAVERAARLYGFDGTAPLPISSEGGTFPTPGDDAERALASIGQGAVAASPLHMASVAAAVASGTWRQPFVTGEPAVSHELPAAAMPVLRDLMRAVVIDGTAAGAGLPGEVFGKTGTAEYRDGNPPPTHGWFVGYRGNVAFAVIIEDGGFGATSAAPVAARFLAALDGV